LNPFSIKSFFPIPLKNKDSLFYYVPKILLVLWIVFSILSIFTVGIKNLTDGFVIFSIIIRIIIAAGGLFFYNIMYIKNNKEKKIYNYFKAYIGYGVVFTYVFFSLPRMVGEFKENTSLNFSIFSFVFVLIITSFPAILYLFLRTSKTKLIMQVYNKNDIEYEKKIKKNRKLKKQEQKKLRKERTFLENLWYEVIDVVIQAILIALLIQQFFFQMYQIPSESMVPTFLINDRVVANKFIFGAHIPLTNWKLPVFKNPKVGDIVVFKNPEMDNPNSEIRYNNVFTRIFHPFIYMLTLSMVDIDKKENGDPKERLLVKRLIAREGEKLCILNDKVYKKTKETKWTLMDEIDGEKEYGQVNLYFNDNPSMETQMINPEIRNILNNAQDSIEKINDNDLSKNLKDSKNNLISKLNNLNIKNFLNKFYNDLKKYSLYTDSIKRDLEIERIIAFHYNKPQIIYRIFEKNNLTELAEQFRDKKYMTQIDINQHNKILEQLLNQYNYVVYYESIVYLYEYLIQSRNNINYFENDITTSFDINENDNPYTSYMKKANAVYKYYLINTFIKIIDDYNNGNIDKILKESNDYSKFISYFKNNDSLIKLTNLDFYFNDYYFQFRNFEEFPSGENNYIEKDNFFMMGDNRYNSHDNRFNNTIDKYYNKEIKIDATDKSYLAKKVNVSWCPRTISIKHVLGKASMIYYPFNRMKVLK